MRSEPLTENLLIILAERIEYIIDRVNFCLSFSPETNKRWSVDFNNSGNTNDTELLLCLRTRKYEYIITKNGNSVCVPFYIPTRWLTESFEEELVAGRELYKKAQEEKQKQEDTEEKEKQEKIKLIKAKLNNEELQLLGLKLDKKGHCEKCSG